MVKLIDNKKRRGGYRPGAGRKKTLEGGGFTPTYLDDPTREIMTQIGDGNLSEGIRLSGRIIKAVIKKYGPEAYENIKIGAEEESS